MEELAERFFEHGKLCVCVKDPEGHVLYQNGACRSLCGDVTSARCEKGCMLRYRFNTDAPTRDEGTQCYANQQIEGEQYDILFINDRECLTTLLYPLRDRHSADMQHLSSYELTKREHEIMGLVNQGFSNAEIAEQLFISKGTLKKHLNNTYKKVPLSAFAAKR